MGATDRLYPKGSTNMFASLARNIAGQQLATAAAFKIHGRFVEACKVSTPLAHGRQRGIITYVMLQSTAAKTSTGSLLCTELTLTRGVYPEKLAVEVCASPPLMWHNSLRVIAICSVHPTILCSLPMCSLGLTMSSEVAASQA